MQPDKNDTPLRGAPYTDRGRTPTVAAGPPFVTLCEFFLRSRLPSVFGSVLQDIDRAVARAELDALVAGVEEQIDAVTSTEGFVRVIAGAGSGKTRALTRRFAYLVNRQLGEEGDVRAMKRCADLLAEKKMGKDFALFYLLMTKSRELWTA